MVCGAAGHQCLLCLEKESLCLKCSIGTLEALLSGGQFVKCHRSYLVNLEHVAAVRRTEEVLDDGRQVPLSRYLYRQVNEAFVGFYRKSP
nr:LytTR family DNA-binding domain-containing protein [uncultured Acetatifactor sp.]